MAAPGQIPDETKWRTAAEFSAAIPALYDRVFRPELGERYDELEQNVWLEASRIMGVIVRHLNLPTSTARELARTLQTVMVILFGPEYKSEWLEVSEDGSVVIVRRCPLIAAAYQSGTDGDRTFHKCMAFTLSGIAGLNPTFSARFVRTMCTGDRQCEIKIAKRNRLPRKTRKNEPAGDHRR